MKMKQQELMVGDSVTYVPDHGKQEHGVVKEIPEHTKDSVRVVYHCNGEWHNFRNYTSAMTPLDKLKKGWL